MVGERRIVTILFCDVQGSTSASQNMDPEEWAEIMNGVFEQMITPIYRYEGFVARLMGDSILAFFGAPIAHEDDPQRAVLAGLDITKAIDSYSEQLFQERGLRLSARVGINTGLVVVGTVGSDLRMEYTAMGDAINLAARMEQTAQPGSVQISAETHKLVAPFFISEDLGTLEIKGKKEPIQAFNIIAPISGDFKRGQFDEQVSPLIGRETEFVKIQGAFEELRRGLGGIVYLTGEAGLGKSRLISEIRSQQNPGEPVRWYETTNLSYESGRPYAPFKRLLRDLMEISADEDQQVLDQKVNDFIQKSHLAESGQFQQVVHTLFGIESGADQPALEGEGFQGMLFTSMLAFWGQQASKQPVVLVFDDLHWSDPASLGLLERLFTLADQVPILFICATRPERESNGWRSMQRAETKFPHRFIQIELLPLTLKQSGQLVDQLIEITNFPTSMRTRILQKADGNPYFVEEVVRSLVDQGFILSSGNGAHWETAGLPDDIDIPDNLQSLLLARIDSLEENSRWILQVAAVIGRTFYYQVLSKLVDIAHGLDQHLVSLQRQQLIQEAARLPELEYVFKHVLVQEVAYGTLLIREKKHYHQLVAQALEEIYPAQTNEYAPLLAYHYEMADDPQRALSYYRIAGDDSFRLYAAGEAINHYSKALKLFLSADPDQYQSVDESRDELLVHLYLRKGRSLELNQEFDLAVINYTEMLDYSKKTENTLLELAAQIAMLTLHSIPGPNFDLKRANQIADGALSLAAKLDDQVAEAKIYWSLTILNVMSRETTTAIGYAERSIEISRQLNLEEQLAYSLNDLARAYVGLGDFDQALSVADEAYSLFEKLGDRPMLGDNILNSAEVHLTLGNYQKAYGKYQEITDIAESIDNTWLRAFGLTGTGQINIEYGNISQGLEMLLEVVDITEQIGIEMLAAGTRSQLALLYAYLGDYTTANEMAEKALQIAQSETYPDYFRTWPYSAAARLFCMRGNFERAKPLLEMSLEHYNPDDYIIIYLKQVSFVKAEYAIAHGNYSEAIDEMDMLVNQLTRKKVRSLLPEALRIKGEAQLGNKQHSEAFDTFLEAKAASEQLAERRQYWMILARLEDLEMQRGNPETAAEYQQLAQDTIAYVADHIIERQLQEKFLSQPEIAQIKSAEIK
jgi:predicted ATPase/class 3 adenylate cyclase